MHSMHKKPERTRETRDLNKVSESNHLGYFSGEELRISKLNSICGKHQRIGFLTTLASVDIYSSFLYKEG